MKMKQKIPVLMILLWLLASCNSGAPSTGEIAPSAVLSVETPVMLEKPAQPVLGKEPVPAVNMPPALPASPASANEKSFNPESIPEDVYVTTKIDVKKLIENLNKVIKAQDYNTWVTHLSDSYLKEIESPEFLSRKTEELYARSLAIAKWQGKDLSRVPKVELKTAKDYFKNVVVPSRKNDHVEDIEYISENQVIAWTQNGGRAKLDILYYLENTGGNWKITNPPQQN